MYRETENLWVAALEADITMRLHILSNLNLTHYCQEAV
jgi:hypothetical protein